MTFSNVNLQGADVHNIMKYDSPRILCRFVVCVTCCVRMRHTGSERQDGTAFRIAGLNQQTLASRQEAKLPMLSKPGQS